MGLILQIQGEVHLMHVRKRLRLVSATFEGGKAKIVDVSDGYRKLREKMTIKDEFEFNIISNQMRTPETHSQTRVQTRKGQCCI